MVDQAISELNCNPWLGPQLLDLPHDGDRLVSIGEDPAGVLSDSLVDAAPDGVLPTVLEANNPGFASRILPLAGSLVYPTYWLDCLAARRVTGTRQDSLATALHGPLVETIRRHTLALPGDSQRRNLFPDGGIKLSSTSNNSWMSKIALFRSVSRAVLRLHDDPAVADLLAAADTAHAGWQVNGVSGYWACSDQFINGEAEDSRDLPPHRDDRVVPGRTPVTSRCPVARRRCRAVARVQV